MKQEQTFLGRLDQRLDAAGEKLKGKEVTLPTDMIGAGLFMILAIVLLVIMPGQVPISDADVVNGRVFPTMLMVLMIICCGMLLAQNIIKMVKKEPLHTCTLNLLVEVKALIILAILLGTYFICKITDLFVVGAVFCCLGFLAYFRCRKKLYYGITIGLAVVIWVAFRFGLGVRF